MNSIFRYLAVLLVLLVSSCESLSVETRNNFFTFELGDAVYVNDGTGVHSLLKCYKENGEAVFSWTLTSDEDDGGVYLSCRGDYPPQLYTNLSFASKK